MIEKLMSIIYEDKKYYPKTILNLILSIILFIPLWAGTQIIGFKVDKEIDGGIEWFVVITTNVFLYFLCFVIGCIFTLIFGSNGLLVLVIYPLLTLFILVKLIKGIIKFFKYLKNKRIKW